MMTLITIVGEYNLLVQKYMPKQSKLRFDCSKGTKNKILILRESSNLSNLKGFL